MATQNEMPLRVVETAAEPPVQTEDDAYGREEWPARDDSLTERFWYNLRVALSALHT